MYLCASIYLILKPLAIINDTSKKLINKSANQKTLVYFASGHYKKEYESLPFDRIYLVDFCFIGLGKRNNGSGNPNIQVSKSGKVICLGMDCLQSVRFLNQHKVKIDAFVALNEGLFEGGGIYPLQNDLFIGFVMPILNLEYIHLVNKNYYGHQYRVTMDLPYNMTLINEGEPDYLNPLVFSSDEYNKEHAKVYRMTKQVTEEVININPNIRTSIIHDSIWNYIDELDLLAISITPQGQKDFFHGSKKVVSLRELSVTEILDYCVENKITRIGFTPWLNGNYSPFVDQIKNYSKEFPKEISLFHLNRKDFRTLKELA